MLARIEARIREAKKLDTSEADERLRAWLKGEDDDRLREWANTQVTTVERRLAKVQAKGHKPTEALAWVDLGEFLVRRAQFADTAEDLWRAVEAMDKAHTLWPEGITGSVGASTRVYAAIVEVAASDVGDAAWLRDQRRRYSETLILEHAEKERPELIARIAVRPELKAAAEALKRHDREYPSTLAWSLGQLLHDSELSGLGRSAFTRPTATTSWRITQLLSPEHDEASQLLALAATIH